jgi:serine/threonine protein kinase
MSDNIPLHSLDWEHFSVTMSQEQTAQLIKTQQWNDRQIVVQWDNVTTVVYSLSPLSLGREAAQALFHQPTGRTYSAQALPHMPRGRLDKFVIRLPDLWLLKDRGRVTEAYQQEYSLRDRFPLGTPDVLPILIPFVWKKDENGKSSMETLHPSIKLYPSDESEKIGDVPCVIREFVKGCSLKTYINARAKESAAEGIFLGLENSREWFGLAEALLTALAELHRERAAHGFVFPGNIVLRDQAQEALKNERPIPRGSIVFINAAENHRSVYFEAHAGELGADQKKFPIRRWYDADKNLYRFGGEYRVAIDGSDRDQKWIRYDLEEASDYYSATDIFSLGVTLAHLASGDLSGASSFDAVSPFDYVQSWLPGWQIVRGAEVRRRYHVMKAKLLDSLMAAARQRAKQQASLGEILARASEEVDQRKATEGTGSTSEENASQAAALLAQERIAFEKRIYEDSLRRAEVILQCVRSRMDRRISSASHALTMVNLFRPPEQVQDAKPYPKSFAATLRDEDYQHLIQLAKAVALDPAEVAPFVTRLLDLNDNRSQEEKTKQPTVPAIQKLVGHRVRSVLERIPALQIEGSGELLKRSPYLRITGSRTTLVDAFLTALSSLSKDDEVIALTTATIFSDDNFGPTSRITSMLQLLRLRGIPMSWVILVSNSDLYKPMTQRVLGFRAADDRRLEKLQPGSFERNEPSFSFYNGFLCACLEPREYEQLLRQKKTFIGFRKSGPNIESQHALDLHIAPDLNSRSGRLVALTFWMYPRRGQRLWRAYEDYHRIARPMFSFERNT